MTSLPKYARRVQGRRIGAAVFCVGWLAVSCSDESPAETDETMVTTGVTGAATSGAGGAPSTGAWSSGSGGTGGESVGLGAPYPVVLAHGFFGFEDFAGVDFATYFYEVKGDLELHGEPWVFTPAVDPFNDSTYRGAQLVARIEAIRAETGHAKVILIGHSQGGLDARVVAHDRPDLVAAVVTVATPHGGTPVADVVLGLLSDPNAQGILADLVNLIGAQVYDQIGSETDVAKPMHLFSQAGIAEFNAAYPDSAGVFYASVTGRTALSFGGQDCEPDLELPFIKAYNSETDPTDPFFYLTEALADGTFGTIPNDGLVRVADAKHGEFWGCVPADHMDEVGQLFGDSPGFGNGFDHKGLYRELVNELRRRGY